MSKEKRNCEKCGEEFLAKTADVKRGWGRHCSKSCAAWKREKKKGFDSPDPFGLRF